MDNTMNNVLNANRDWFNILARRIPKNYRNMTMKGTPFALTAENTNMDGEYMKNAGLNRFWLLAVVLTMVLGWGAMASAQGFGSEEFAEEFGEESAGEFNGKWHGVVTVIDKSVPVEMTVEHSSSVIHFMSPFNCSIKLEYPMIDNGTNYMAGVDSCSGGHCDDLWNGRLKLHKSQDDAVEILLSDKHMVPWGQGTLNRQ